MRSHRFANDDPVKLQSMFTILYGKATWERPKDSSRPLSPWQYDDMFLVSGLNSGVPGPRTMTCFLPNIKTNINTPTTHDM